MAKPASTIAPDLSPGPSPSGGPAADALALARGALQQGDYGAAGAAYRRLLEIEPDHFEAVFNLAGLAVASGDLTEAAALYRRGVAVQPDHLQTRMNLARVLCTLGDQAGEIAQYREILERQPDHAGARIDLMDRLASTGTPARLADFAPDLRPEDIGTHVLVACMPKSGSTYLKRLLCLLTGWNEANFAYGYLQNEQELYLPNILAAARSNAVIQQHCRATEANIQLVQGFAMRPVVLVRDLRDIIVSLADFYDQGAVANTFFAAGWARLDRARRLDLLIDQVMPWYLAFYASWVEAAESGRIDCLLLRYEDLIADKAGTLQAIAAYLGLAKAPQECQAAVAAAEQDRGGTRYNKGRAGRGADALTPAQTARLRGQAAYFPTIDFGPIGL